MNSFTVYLVMQASTLWGVLMAFTIIALFVKLFLATFSAINLNHCATQHTKLQEEITDYQRRAKGDALKEYYASRVLDLTPDLAVKKAELERAQQGAKVRNFKQVGVFAITMSLILGFLPSTKTLCAAYVIPSIANSQMVQKDFPELYDLAINKLKEQLK